MTATWLSILPPLLAIALALLTRQVIPALLAGVWLGAWLLEGATLTGLGTSLLDTVGVHIVDALADRDHVMIVVATLMIGGLVGVIRRNGGTDGIVKLVTRWAATPRRGQLATSGLGLAIFFDDYANSLVVGNTMRPITDRLRISREKLAYIVDSTAAPVAACGLFTTWIGYQVGLVDDAVGKIGIDQSGFAVFVSSLRYAFYPVLAVVLVFAVAASRRDFGPMVRAEQRARESGTVLRPGSNLGAGEDTEAELRPEERTPRRFLNALVPILALVVTTFVGLLATGSGSTVFEIMGNGDPFAALVWGSLVALLVAAVLSFGQRILSLGQFVDAWFAGIKSVLYVVIILSAAWALSSLTEELKTAEFLAGALSEALPAPLLPAILFVLAAAVAFATGTSWGTMGILTPLAVPLAWSLLQAQGAETAGGHPIIYASVATVLAGAVWGDHCSPISDTTVISSLASQCDVVDHVRTQIPYALYAGGIAVVIGLLPIGFGFPWWASFLVSIAVLLAGLRLLGRRVPGDAGERRSEEAGAM
ncbi:sodium:proton antiporter [Actinopolyspora erythraea]|uniref:Sodium:proton antiporter n=1 Tax=Actinopolyspora erythraea TaxID=414996 RepID=A0A223RVY4_9ACTN|nr:Na+/H+ antiporter NhaC family protein [Actinopolyspora erythraea]ASU80030.1 sodium:proton antiporter [Actinopolyspora erythraea]